MFLLQEVGVRVASDELWVVNDGMVQGKVVLTPRMTYCKLVSHPAMAYSLLIPTRRALEIIES